ncbi:IS3 family transposase [Gimesia maris]|uniref:IS3 family transposase n=1 Tax=Gimesia maris TaxID=122 RepID=UPI0021BC41BF|nr:IS3 family transposase [Gimesia maris]
MVSPSRKRAAVKAIQNEFRVSERRACVALDQPRSTQRYQSSPRSDEPSLVKRMYELVRSRPRFGYRRIARLLQREGWQASFTRVYRLWRREGLKVPQEKRKRRRTGDSRNGCHLLRPEQKDHVWCWDFVFDRTTSGSSLKWFSIVDEFTRECLTLKVDRSIRSEDVIDTLAELFSSRGVPQCIRSDNGPEFISKAIRRWLSQLELNSLYIEPGAPWENGYAESFNSRFRDEFLAVEVFESLGTARRLTDAWKEDYNGQRPHSSLGYVTPAEFASRCAVSNRAAPSFQLHSDTYLNQPS